MEKDDYYTKEYFEKRDFFPHHFAETLNLELKSLPVKKVLDVGCGTGRLVKFLKDQGYEAIGCDSSDEAIKISGQIKAQATRLPFKNGSFDLVTAISLIEHLKPKEAERFIEEAKRVLRPRGYFFLITPNFLSPMRFLKGKSWFGYLDPTHVKFYSPVSLKKLLEKHRFSNFKFRFRVDPKTCADWSFFASLIPPFLVNCLLISTPLAYFRDSFWVSCQKTN